MASCLIRVCAAVSSGVIVACRACTNCCNSAACPGRNCKNAATTSSSDNSCPSPWTFVVCNSCSIFSRLSFVKSGPVVAGAILDPGFWALATEHPRRTIHSKAKANRVFLLMAVSLKRAFRGFTYPDTATALCVQMNPLSQYVFFEVQNRGEIYCLGNDPVGLQAWGLEQGLHHHTILLGLLP